MRAYVAGVQIRFVSLLAVIFLLGCGHASEPGSEPKVELSVTSVMLAAPAGGADPAPQDIAVTSPAGSSSGELAVAVSYPPGSVTGWLQATLDGTTAPATLTVRATAAGLPPGTYGATVTLSASGAGDAPLAIPVTLTVTPVPSITLGASSIAFTGTTCLANPAPRTVDITNGGTGSLTGLGAAVRYASGSAWLSASFGATTAPAVLTLSPTVAGLAAGSYSATVDVTSPVGTNSPQPVAVTLAVESRPVVKASAPDVSFSAAYGSGTLAPKTLDVTNGCATSGALTGLATTVLYAGGEPVGWLTATLNQTTAPATLTLQPAVGALTLGTYHASVEIASASPGAAGTVIPVALTIREPALTTNLSPSDGGTLTRTPDQGSYAPGTIVTLRATARTGWVFSEWTGDLASTANPATVTMDGDRAVTAHFALVPPLFATPSIDAGGLVTLSWTFTPPCGATSCQPDYNVIYDVEESPAPDGAFVLLRSVNGSYLSPGIDSTTVYKQAGTYYFRVRARTAYGATGYSAVRSVTSTITTPPSAPAGLAATGASYAIDLTWTNTAPDASQMQLERCSGAGCTDFARAITLTVDRTIFSIRESGVQPGIVFRYRVRALNAAGYSAYSNIAEAVATP